MRGKRTYIAGPMRGIPFFNFPKFFDVESLLSQKGYYTINPARLDEEAGYDIMALPDDTDWTQVPPDFDFEACRKRDIEAIETCEAIYLLDGWMSSKGALAEKAYAEWMGLEVLYEVEPTRFVDKGAVIDSTYEKETNPKDAIGSNKIPLHLWPTTASIMGSLGMLNGMLKYGRSNFRAIGIRASIYYDACRRHLDAWFEGEECDPDDGVPHLSAAIACLAIIIDALAADKLNDDRIVEGGYRPFIDDMTKHVSRLKELHKGKEPKHYTIQDNKATKKEEG
jgi:hypothetical protein